MNGEALLALAERVEAATGVDRELDCLIYEWRFRELDPSMRGMYYGEPTGEYFRDGGETVFRAPRFTASLDAALSLVSDGQIWMLTNSSVEAREPNLFRASALVGPPDDTTAPVVEAATPSLALTAACLRALAKGPHHVR